MNGHSNLTYPDVPATETSSSPFVGGARSMDAPGIAEAADYRSGEQGPMGLVSSPFADGLLGSGRSEADEAFGALVSELTDEGFDEAVQDLVDEAAGRHLTSAGTWSSEATGYLATGEVQNWMAELAAEADRMLEHVEQHFAARTPESLTDGEVDAALAELLAEAGPRLDGENFFGALARKAGSLLKGAAKLAKRGVAFAGRLVLGPLVGALRRIVPALLNWVLRKALNLLPENMRNDAAALAASFGITLPTAPTAPAAAATEPVPAGAADPAAGAEPTAGAALAELFDAHLAEAVLGGDQPATSRLTAEAQVTVEEDGRSAVAGLDAARATLTEQLAAAETGSVLTTEVEQFIPAVMAALPLIRAGIRVIGRDRVVGLIARPLAELIKGRVGPDATKVLSRAIADKGLALLRLEAESATDGRLGAEALVSMLEDTIRAVGELPAESLAEPLRVRAELQEAFGEAAARHLPAELLRADLDTNEIDGESAVWVMMPRGPGRRYRYRKCSRTFPVRISRNVARAVVLADGGTLEQRFLDEGTAGWPAEAEVHLYEALPGTHLGQLAASEDRADTSEFELLTPGTAALLLGQPGVGRAGYGVGRRYFRVVPGRGWRHPRQFKRAVVVLVLTGPRPVLRVHLRLSERAAHRLTELLAQGADVRIVTGFRSLILGLAKQSLPARIARQAQRTPDVALTAEQTQTLAAAVGERMVVAVAQQLRSLAPALAAAARDPAEGLTLTFEFGFADRAALAAGRPDAPNLTVRPGRHRD
ncbi:hypothetical protein BJ973_004062 [Actinoplanes tereljensis]|uniref:Uncharacterized protein n=1 Tax=Paractinoplanes tereljensis TaxID=571912 RepID=A0A919TWN5_9ACTN|nr:hypothetical protein [Actinoplanes tereljensis]GIF23450.1 hypothetical protein Ate02nite_61800 [Actinoplanes tereljensis]